MFHTERRCKNSIIIAIIIITIIIIIIITSLLLLLLHFQILNHYFGTGRPSPVQLQRKRMMNDARCCVAGQDVVLKTDDLSVSSRGLGLLKWGAVLIDKDESDGVGFFFVCGLFPLLFFLSVSFSLTQAVLL